MFKILKIKEWHCMQIKTQRSCLLESQLIVSVVMKVLQDQLIVSVVKVLQDQLIP